MIEYKRNSLNSLSFLIGKHTPLLSPSIFPSLAPSHTRTICKPSHKWKPLNHIRTSEKCIIPQYQCNIVDTPRYTYRVLNSICWISSAISEAIFILLTKELYLIQDIHNGNTRKISIVDGSNIPSSY